MALLPPSLADCVVAIGASRPGSEPQWLASGFLYGKRHGTGDDGKGLYQVYLVTNRHVVDRAPSGFTLCIRVNPEADGPARTYPLSFVDSAGRSTWFFHSNSEVDVAVSPIDFNVLRRDAMQVQAVVNDKHVATVDKMRDLGVSEGDFAYVLGFPMGLVGGSRSTVIVRGGTIARVRDALVSAEEPFLVDAFIFPGNSGGPVILRPETTAVEGTKPVTSAWLIGLVASYRPYVDIAYSKQTDRPRIVFEDNSGLADVFTVDCIDGAIAAHEKYVQTLPPAMKEEAPKPQPVPPDATAGTPPVSSE